MCFLSNSQFQTKDRGRVEIEKLTNQDILLGVDGKEYEIVDLYKLNEYINYYFHTQIKLPLNFYEKTFIIINFSCHVNCSGKRNST